MISPKHFFALAHFLTNYIANFGYIVTYLHLRWKLEDSRGPRCL